MKRWRKVAFCPAFLLLPKGTKNIQRYVGRQMINDAESGVTNRDFLLCPSPEYFSDGSEKQVLNMCVPFLLK